MTELKKLTESALDIRELFKEFERNKNKHSWSRSDLLRGFIGDVGDLTKLSMAADGLRDIADHKNKLGHEFADCLWSLLVLAEEYEIDLESEFDKLIKELTIKLKVL